jgi:ATP-dependent helicase Lhr and Lhr-like helicase
LAYGEGEALLPPAFEAWFAGRGWAPRPHQLAMVEQARARRHTLLIAPTGGGKTLAGFLPTLIDLATRPKRNTPGGVHTLYVSPLKALATDVQRNLLTPVQEMKLDIRVEARTGDTPVSRRQRQKSRPPEILLTTPEQIALLCAWPGAREWFSDLDTVILDEIHALHGSKRGDLLNLGLARLQSFAPNLRRVGLSATVDDPDILRRWLAPQAAGSREQVAATPSPGADGTASLPAPCSLPPDLADLVRGAPGAAPVIDVLLSEEHVPWSGHTARHAMAEVLDAIRGAKLSLIFVNTRFQAELAFQTLWSMNEENLPIALHHGSLSTEQRRKVEAAMADGRLRAVVCTSTLDLGIDWGEVDLVIQLAAPKGSSRLVQRIGRANHRLDEPSRALLVPANRFEVLECQAAREAVAENDLDGEPERVGALDILAQHVMGVACGEAFDMQALYEEVRTCAPYARLSWEDWEDVVDLVSTGGYALRVYDKFKRILQGEDGLWRARDGFVAQKHRLNLGAIIDYPSLNIRLVSRGKRVGGRKLGEMEESYIEMLSPGDVFLFAGQLLRYEAVDRTDCFVSRAPPNAEAQVPSWGGSKFPLSTYLAKRVRRLLQDEDGWRRLPADVQEWLFAQKQRSLVPTDEDFLVETFRRGRREYLVCYPFEGRIAHTTLAMLLTRRLERAGAMPLGYVCNDYALAIWAMRPMAGLDLDELFQTDMLGDDLESWLDESFMMKRTFRRCAVIAGIIERRFPGQEKTGRQVTFSTDLIYDVLRRHQPDHILLRCARADAATGLLDVARLGALLHRIAGRIRPVHLTRVSPFSVPLMMEIGREIVYGASADAVLEEAETEAALIAEAMG